MPTPLFCPTKEADLLAWSANFDQKITLTPTAFGLSAAQATAYTTLHETFNDAYLLTINPNTNSKSATIAKNQAKEALLNGPGGARELVNIVQYFPGTTDAERGTLGLRLKDVAPSPVPEPSRRPGLTILAMVNRTVTIKLNDITDETRRGKPPGVDGATILYHVGATAPTDPSAWTFLMNTSKTAVEAELPMGVPAGSTVWFSAVWFNQRKQTSPPATPQSSLVGGGLAMAA